MTLAELEDTLPNGFHDAMIYGLNIDYKDQTVVLDVELSYSRPGDSAEVPGYRRALVTVSGLKILVIDPPNASPQYGVLDGDELFTQGFSTASDEHWKAHIDPRLIEAAGTEAPLYSFFVNSWNSCIHIAAMHAAVTWTEDETSAAARQGTSNN